ncbi:MAG: FHA domain-containing protein [Planctomycetota bacterium]|nr:FHA domain-containing protein [Planctomycetota bacterium]
MPASFSLRIESGDQAGETHALEGSGLTVGRRPGNDLVLHDPSVSGRHARLSIEAGRIMVVDFGSTNGTFVDGERVEDSPLDPGTSLRFGKVDVSVHAGEPPAVAAAPAAAPAAMPAASPPPRPEPEPELDLEDDLDLELEDSAEPGAPGNLDDDFDDEVHQIDAADLGRAGKGPGLLPLVLAAVVALGGAGWYFAGMPGLPGGAGDDTPQRAVAKVPGNLLADPSFEGDDLGGEGAAWQLDETAPVSPWVADAWRAGGELGLGCDLEDGEWALVRSKPVLISRSRGMRLGATAWAEGSASIQLGLAFLDDQGDHPPARAWTAPMTEASGDSELELAVVAPPGYESVRVLLRASATGGAGSAAFDDIFLVDQPGQPAAQAEGFTGLELGSGQLTISHADRPLIVKLGAGGSASVRVSEGGLAVELGGRDLELVLDPGFFAEGLATLGTGGYQPHGDAFEDEGVTSIVLGQGVHQMRLDLGAPTTLVGRPLAQGFRLSAKLQSSSLELELGFAEERAQAARLHTRAQNAERDGDLSMALGAWGKLLDEVPFDAELVLAAEAGRARLIAAGLAELDELQDDFERARFFGIPDLFDQCLAGIADVGARYAGSEVETVASSLGERLAGEAKAAVGADVDELAAARAAVLELIDSTGSKKLADHLRARDGASSTLKGND